MDIRILIKPAICTAIGLIGPYFLPNAWGILLGLIILVVVEWFVPDPHPAMAKKDEEIRNKLKNLNQSFVQSSDDDKNQSAYGALLLILELSVGFGLYFVYGLSAIYAYAFISILSSLTSRFLFK